MEPRFAPRAAPSPVTSIPSSNRCASRGSRSRSSHHCSARPSRSPRHATYSTFGSRGSAVSFSSSSPRASSVAARRRGSQPTPSASRCARIFARIDGTASSDWPPSSPYARPTARRDESATTTARWAPIASRLSGPATDASGWRGATANTHSIAPSSNHLKPGMAGGSLVAPMTRSARPSRSASHVPPSTSCVKRSDTPDSSASNARTTGSSVSNSSTSSLTIHSRSSQPLATCRTRCVSRATSSARRAASSVSS